MSILSGETYSLLQGDIEMLRNDLKNFMMTAEVENEDRINEINDIITRFNVMSVRIDFIENYLASIDRRLKDIENKTRGRYYEREKTNYRS